MKARTIVFTLAMCLVGAAVCFAQDANLGTWKLNEAKSNLAKGAPKNTTVVYEAVGENVKVTIDGVGSDGKPTHNEFYMGRTAPARRGLPPTIPQRASTVSKLPLCRHQTYGQACPT
jgi:hypothetical protein